jgi:hypothetical protein
MPVQLAAAFPKPVAAEYKKHWSAIRTSYKLHGLRHTYNFRASDYPDVRHLMRLIYGRENGTFKVNVSVGFMLRRKKSLEEEDEQKLPARYFWPSRNHYCLEEPFIISSSEDVEVFSDQIDRVNLEEYALSHR